MWGAVATGARGVQAESLRKSEGDCSSPAQPRWEGCPGQGDRGDQGDSVALRCSVFVESSGQPCLLCTPWAKH